MGLPMDTVLAKRPGATQNPTEPAFWRGPRLPAPKALVHTEGDDEIFA